MWVVWIVFSIPVAQECVLIQACAAGRIVDLPSRRGAMQRFCSFPTIAILLSNASSRDLLRKAELMWKEASGCVAQTAVPYDKHVGMLKELLFGAVIKSPRSMVQGEQVDG